MNDNANGGWQQVPNGPWHNGSTQGWGGDPSQPGHPQAGYTPPPNQQETQPQPQPMGGPTWVPAPQAPRPGTLSLRPQEFSDAFTVGWSTMRANLRTVIGVNIIPMLLVFVCFAVGGGVLAATGVFESLAESSEPPAGALGGLFAAFAVAFLLIAFVSTAVHAANTFLFGQSALGRKATARRALGVGLRRSPTLIAIGILLFLAVGLPLCVVFAGMLALTLGNDEPMAAVMGMFLLFPLVALAWIAVMPRLAFTAYAVVLEGRGPVAALKRSLALTRGRYWRTLGVVLVISIMAWITSSFLTAPMQFVMPVLTTGLEEGSAPGAGTIIAFIVFGLIFFVLSLVAQSLAQAFTNAGIGAMYADARIRDEGLAQQIAQLTGAFHPTPADAPVTLQPGELEFPR